MARNLEQKIEAHTRMAEAYRDAYLRRDVQAGAGYASWRFADDARYASPYFTGNQVVRLQDVIRSTAVVATMEARAYTVNFADWGPAKFTFWAAENGFAMRTRWEGHTADGVLMGFYSIGFVETNDGGEITRWETHVNDEEYGPFLQVAIGARGPFHGEGYVEALSRHLSAHGLA